jgi:hypothetical protein
VLRNKGAPRGPVPDFCTPTARSRTVTVLRLRHQVIALQSDIQHRSLVSADHRAEATEREVPRRCRAKSSRAYFAARARGTDCAKAPPRRGARASSSLIGNVFNPS